MLGGKVNLKKVKCNIGDLYKIFIKYEDEEDPIELVFSVNEFQQLKELVNSED